MTKKLTSVFILFWVATSLVAQGDYPADTLKLTKNQIIEIADRYYNEAQYYTAINFYRKALEAAPENPHATFGMAMALVFARDYKRAEEAFSSFYSSGGDRHIKYEEGRFYYGTVLHRLGKYSEAKSQLEEFLNSYRPESPEEGAFFIQIANTIIKACDSADQIPKAKISVEHMPKGINRAYNDYAPAIYNDRTLYFTGTPVDSVKKTVGDLRLSTNIYRVAKKKDKWEKPQKVSAWVNETGYINSDGKFNKDRSRFYFTRCIERENGTALCNIFYSAVEKNKGLAEPIRLPDNVNHPDKYSSSQPTTRATKNPEEEYIYFVSDRPGGLGGMDIWYTFRTETDSLAEPVHLDNGVNTIGDEQSPYWDDSSHTLYFSSNGHVGFGGFDVFKIEQGKGGKWSSVENLGKPINSGADDLYYTIDKNQTYGFFSSNREGSIPLNGIATGADDIYMWEPFHYAFCGRTIWKETGDSLSAIYRLYRKNFLGDRFLIAVDTSNSDHYMFKLNPDIEYEIEVSNPFYSSETATISTKNMRENDTIKKDFALERSAIVIEGEMFDQKYPKMKVNGSATILLFEIGDDNSRKMIGKSSVPSKTNRYSIKAPLNKNLKLEVHKEGYFGVSEIISTKNLDAKTVSILTNLLVEKMILKDER